MVRKTLLRSDAVRLSGAVGRASFKKLLFYREEDAARTYSVYIYNTTLRFVGQKIDLNLRLKVSIAICMPHCR